MGVTQLLNGQALIVFAIAIGAVWGAAQWAAHMLGYQPRLGPSRFVLGSTRFYLPWRLFEWWHAYEAHARLAGA